MGNTLVEKVSTALLSMQRYSWEQGVAMQAFLEMGQFDTVCAMAFESINRSIEDGRAAVIGVTDGVTDHCSIGEGLKKPVSLPEMRFWVRAVRNFANGHWKEPQEMKPELYIILQEPKSSGQIPFICFRHILQWRGI